MQGPGQPSSASTDPDAAEPRSVTFGRGDAGITRFVAAGQGIYTIPVCRTGYQPG